MAGSASPLLITGPIVYVRLHGFDRKYGGTYPDDVLAEWAEWIARAAADGRYAFVYFNNDMNGYAVHDATRLTAMVAKLGGRVASNGSAVAAVPSRRSQG
jgi:uncharacterized protein YecE (DUF72 family)